MHNLNGINGKMQTSYECLSDATTFDNSPQNSWHIEKCALEMK